MCGICLVTGVDEKETGFSAEDISDLILFKLQHRGQESTGKKRGVLSGLPWSMGHNRYSTVEGKENKKEKEFNKQPLKLDNDSYIAHNGQFGGFKQEIEHQKDILRKKGYKFNRWRTSDTELFWANYETTKGNLEEKIRGAFQKSGGSGAIVAKIDDYFVAGSRVGNRPLFKADIEGGGKIFCSEDYMLREIFIGEEFVNVKNIQKVTPGTFTILENGKETTHDLWDESFVQRPDAFERIYFSKHLSSIDGMQLHKLRKELGRELGKLYAPDVDVVSSVPRSGDSATAGYIEQTGLDLDEVIDRDNYKGRTFIWSNQEMREKSASLKFNTNWDAAKGKKILLIDDSLVRGTTMIVLARKLYRAGAKEVHVGVASPKVLYPTCYGIDFPTAEELRAPIKTQRQGYILPDEKARPSQEIAKEIGLTSIGYLPLDVMFDVFERTTGIARENFSAEMFNGKYFHRDPDYVAGNHMRFFE